MLEAILDKIEQAVIVLDSAEHVIHFNGKAFELSKYLMDRPLRFGELAGDFCQRTSSGKMREILNSIRTTSASLKAFTRIVNNQGTTIFLEIDALRVKSTHEEDRFLILISDVTQQKVFENKLVNQTSYIADLFHKSNAVIFATDMRGYITDWNDHASLVTGFAKNEVYAQKASILMNESSRIIFDEYVLRVLNSESAGHEELPIVRKSGEASILLVSATPRRSTTGATVGLTFVGQDVTELSAYRRSLETKVQERTRELQRALTKEQEAVELKARFVSIASHEFRIPLASIQFVSETLRAHLDQLSSVEVISRLRDIEAKVEHMTALLNDVLSYDRNAQPSIKLKLSEVTLQKFMAAVCEDVQRMHGSSHRILMELPPKPVRWMTDEKMMRSIVTNLLNNAIKFSPGQGKVYLEVHTELDWISICVRDMGIGIPEDERDLVFEPFSRGKQVSAIQGTGLGLSIVKKSVELLQGSLQLNSQVGKGTEIRIKIPLELSSTI